MSGVASTMVTDSPRLAAASAAHRPAAPEPTTSTSHDKSSTLTRLFFPTPTTVYNGSQAVRRHLVCGRTNRTGTPQVVLLDDKYQLRRGRICRTGVYRSERRPPQRGWTNPLTEAPRRM